MKFARLAHFWGLCSRSPRPGGLLVPALALLLVLPVSLAAQPSPAAQQPGKGAGPRWGPITRLEVAVTNRIGLKQLVEAGYDVGSVHGSRVVIYADRDECASLQGAGWQFKVLEPAPSGLAEPKALGAYNDYSNMTAMLDAYASSYPAICRKLSVGKSAQNRDLWTLKITSKPDLASDKPKFKYISTMHGDEPLGTEMCLYLIDRLLSGYATNDARSVNIVNNVEVWILPLMNPDGREASPPQRYNANGYDLNRSFP